MKRSVRIATIIGGLAAAGIATILAGAARWNRRTARIVAAFDRGVTRDATGAETTYSPTLLAGLPAPVVRYFTFALQPGQRLVRGARVEHVGTFAAKPDRWEPFTSVQHFRVRPPGFVWDATIRMGGLPSALAVRVRDSYLDGVGAMLGAVAALVPVVDVADTPEMAAGALARYLAESAWLPTALLPGASGAGVRWTAIDDSTARATLVDGVVSVWVDFHFGPHGEITRVSGERYRDVDGRGILTPWEGYFGQYERREGMMVPTTGEVAWLLPQGPRPYWRGRIAEVAVEWR